MALCLPIAEEHTGHGILINGEFIPGAPEEARFLVGELCLTFLREDILDIERAAESEDPPPHRLWMRIVVRKVLACWMPVRRIFVSHRCREKSPLRLPLGLPSRTAHLLASENLSINSASAIP